MSSEIKELNKMLCESCMVNDYESCKSCKVHQLVNKVFEKVRKWKLKCIVIVEP